MRFFQCEEFDRLFVRFPVNADIGNRLHPVACSRVQCVQAGRQLQAVEEVFLYVPDTGFHTAFFVWPSHVTSTWLEAVVCCKVQVARMKERLFSSRMLEHSGLRIVDVMCPGTLCGLDLGICRFCWVEHVNLGT